MLIFIIILTGELIACEKPSSISDASDVVIQYLEALKNNDNTTLQLLNNEDSDIITDSEVTLGVISLTIDKVEVSDNRTQRIKEQYTGSDLAKSYGWSDNYIHDNLIAVYAEYTVDYDNTKVPYDEGKITQYFYLVRTNSNSPWRIWASSYDISD
ncbi:DUF4829 domain-containing protein [Oxobacter pfennigii]|uniref:DUF4829 domain-containing protein n=1 Tax=Oxobacter pfennigii TaxID=36849 RepID=UPI001364AFE1|nr:DUF4829 domain-containing protein [Oxobacter pfennigii]